MPRVPFLLHSTELQGVELTRFQVLLESCSLPLMPSSLSSLSNRFAGLRFGRSDRSGWASVCGRDGSASPCCKRPLSIAIQFSSRAVALANETEPPGQVFVAAVHTAFCRPILERLSDIAAAAARAQVCAAAGHHTGRGGRPPWRAVAAASGTPCHFLQPSADPSHTPLQTIT